MYYRYKVKKREKRWLKAAVAGVLVCLALYKIYDYRQNLLFWRYSTMKLEKKIEDAVAIGSTEMKVQNLRELATLFDRRKREGRPESDSYLFSGRVHYLLGEAYLGQSFAETVINEGSGALPRAARREFIASIKDFNKAVALSESYDFKVEYMYPFARALYFVNYIALKDIYALIAGKETPADIDNIRFYAYVKVLSKNEEEGLQYLSRNGKCDDIMGRLFLATLEKKIRRYTSAIVNYKEILNRTTDEDSIKRAHLNLGIIYNSQSLFDESILHLNEAMKLDARDNRVKILLGRSYHALGLKDKARALWNEVLASDHTNTEARKLLGIM